MYIHVSTNAKHSIVSFLEFFKFIERQLLCYRKLRTNEKLIYCKICKYSRRLSSIPFLFPKNGNKLIDRKAFREGTILIINTNGKLYFYNLISLSYEDIETLKHCFRKLRSQEGLIREQEIRTVSQGVLKCANCVHSCSTMMQIELAKRKH